MPTLFLGIFKMLFLFVDLIHLSLMFTWYLYLKVIGKLSEGKASHIPYRDSKLTRLLQSSLSGHGHVSVSYCKFTFPFSLLVICYLYVISLDLFSLFFLLTNLPWLFLQLICTITPATSNMEETHNTLKFASRAKRVEIFASHNRVGHHFFFFLIYWQYIFGMRSKGQKSFLIDWL